MRWSRAALLLLSLVIQTSVFPHITPSGLIPDLILVIVVLIGLHEAPREAAWWGALGGLVADLFAGRFIGFHIVTKTVAAYIASVVGLKLYRHNLGIPLVLGGVSTIIQELLMLGLLHLTGIRFALIPTLSTNIMPHALANAVIAALLSRLIYRAFATPSDSAVEG